MGPKVPSVCSKPGKNPQSGPNYGFLTVLASWRNFWAHLQKLVFPFLFDQDTFKQLTNSLVPCFGSVRFTGSFAFGSSCTHGQTSSNGYVNPPFHTHNAFSQAHLWFRTSSGNPTSPKHTHTHTQPYIPHFCNNVCAPSGCHQPSLYPLRWLMAGAAMAMAARRRTNAKKQSRNNSIIRKLSNPK